MNENNIKWLSDWYMKNCNGEWEHHYGIKIETLDNPGWYVTIDTEDSILELKTIPWVTVEKSENDWYSYKHENGKFEASGDPTKLEYLIYLFREIIENKL